VLERGVVLEHEPDPAPLGGQGGGVAAVDLDAAGVGPLQPGDHPQQGRLAAARGAEQGGQGAAGDLHRHVVQGGEVPEAAGRVRTRMDI
jgi:hypothetical protein